MSIQGLYRRFVLTNAVDLKVSLISEQHYSRPGIFHSRNLEDLMCCLLLKCLILAHILGYLLASRHELTG